VKPALVLCDDPRESGSFELESALAKRGPFRLIAVLEPEPAETSPIRTADDGISTVATTYAGTTRPEARYRFRQAASKNGSGPRSFGASEAAATLSQLAAGPFVLVAFVSPATVPLVAALHADERTRAFLRCGVTLPRLDRDYNLAQTLVSEGKLHYHEHSQHLEKMLQKRLQTMLRLLGAGQKAAGGVS
jgi:hypothetical protein